MPKHDRNNNADNKHLPGKPKLQEQKEQKEHNLEETVEIHDEKLQTVNLKNETLQLEVEQLHAKISKLEETNKTLNESAEQSAADKQNYINEILQLRETNDAKDVEIRNANGIIDALQFEMKRLQSKLVAAYKELNENAENFENAEQKYRATIKQLEQSIAAKDDEIRNANAEHQMLQLELQTEKNEKEELREQVFVLRNSSVASPVNTPIPDKDARVETVTNADITQLNTPEQTHLETIRQLEESNSAKEEVLQKTIAEKNALQEELAKLQNVKEPDVLPKLKVKPNEQCNMM
jgi:DNA repair exonuclease SbcCD ATPase subunit